MAKHIYKAQRKRIRRVDEEQIDTQRQKDSVAKERDAIQAELKKLLDEVEQALDDC